MARTHLTRGAQRAAILSWEGPVKIADGRISPKTNTKTTEKSTAAQGGANLSTNIGKASFASALRVFACSATY